MSHSKFFFIITSLLILFAACATTQRIPEPPAPKKYKGWHLNWSDSLLYIGIDAGRAYTEFLIDKEPKKKVVVAVIDTGVDRLHEDLKDVVWINSDEIDDNGIDDDNNGYIDDIYGWNFIGGPDGSHVEYDSYELARIYWGLNKLYEGKERDEIDFDKQSQWDYYQEIKEEVEIEIEYLKYDLRSVQELNITTRMAMDYFDVETLEGIEDVSEIESIDLARVDYFAREKKDVLDFLIQEGITEKDIDAELEVLRSSIAGLEEEIDTREETVGDDYLDFTNRYYGNNDVVGPYASHGTHVAGVIAAAHNGIGIKGVSNQAELMILRVVPNGDERDKDVANAIRYAVENGADIINMSFGKAFSPHKPYVDEAVKFADSMGVLMIHAAGNDAIDIDDEDHFPRKRYADGSGEALHWITVGASSWEGEQYFAADFSNYGRDGVDVFAPGVDIYSSSPSDSYKYDSGTSMAAPVVTGIASIIMAYYPELTPLEVKDVILESVLLLDDMEVVMPGSTDDELIPFGSLSLTGGIVNLYDALIMAEEFSKN